MADAPLWHAGTQELHSRTEGIRESGAFLLGRKGRRGDRIAEFLFYEEVDPTCFRHGIVELDGRRLGLVWERCRERDLTVVADVHVHPHGFRQSESDRHNPILAAVGHVAIILPNFAAGKPLPGEIGIYEYAGARTWRDRSCDGARFFHVGWWPW